MNVKHVLALAAILITTQAFSMENLIQKQGCNNEVGDCPSDGGGGGGAATFLGSWMGAGSHWDSFSDSEGEFDIETKPDGTTKVYFWDKAKAAPLIKKPTQGSKVKRSQLQIGALVPATKSKAQIQAENVAQAAAAAAKAAVEAANKAAGIHTGPAISSTPAGGGVVLNARKKP